VTYQEFIIISDLLKKGMELEKLQITRRGTRGVEYTPFMGPIKEILDLNTYPKSLILCKLNHEKKGREKYDKFRRNVTFIKVFNNKSISH